MIAGRAGVVVFAMVWASARVAAQAPTLAITSPEADAVTIGQTRIEAEVAPTSTRARVTFSVDGRTICTVEQAPFACVWDAGGAAREHHVRVVAYLENGSRAVANVRTRGLGYTERVDVDAVQVPAIVTRNGQFVRGLQRADFTVLEDGVAQRIESLVSENTPLDLVLAIDISGSMNEAVDDVKRAVKQLLSKLRPRDAATLIGFNETTFIVAERETDQQAREDAVDLLTSWGGTALYDATIKAVELVRPQRGRKGVVIFSDGDDRDSVARRETAMAAVQSSDAMLFTVAFGRGGNVPELKRGLETYARTSGGRAFFASTTKELDAVFGEIVQELANQYVLSYTPPATSKAGAWHALEVTVRGRGYHVRAREGYRRAAPAKGK
jgi:VWFA-related protein